MARTSSHPGIWALRSSLAARSLLPTGAERLDIRRLKVCEALHDQVERPVPPGGPLPARWRSKVDLPEPEAPISATISPGAICRLRASRAFRPLLKVLLRP